MVKSIGIVTDLTPDFAGANRIAWRTALECADAYSVTFFCGFFSREKISHKTDRFNTRYISISRAAANRLGVIKTLLNSVYKLHRTIVVFKNIRQSGVNLVWIHQIGNVFSTILVLLLRSTGKPIIWTLHDFSFLNKNKLYPKDIGFQSKLYSLHSGGSNEFDSPKTKLRVSNWRIFLRSLYFRIISIGTILVPISEMQKVILESFGFKTSAPIGNGVDKCTCINQSYRDTKAILFAGRLIGKGLSHLIQIIKNSNSLRLVLAGDEFLLEQAREELSDRQFEYHGRCSSDQVAALIHKVGFVAVLSDCFDVYPSILLESVSHGAFPITYPSVGNSQIAFQIHPRLLLPYGEHLGEHELEEILKDRQGGELMELDSFAKMCSQYSQLIDLLLKR